MSDSKDDPFAVSRRVVIGAASATPLLAGARPASPSDDVTARCDAWLALDAEIDGLLSRWSDLENVLVKEKRWHKMTPDQREALSPTEEMDAIDKQVKGLFEQRRQGLDALPALVARDMRGVASKLQVAVKVMDHERGDGFELFKGAVAQMQACDAPIAARPSSRTVRCRRTQNDPNRAVAKPLCTTNLKFDSETSRFPPLAPASQSAALVLSPGTGAVRVLGLGFIQNFGACGKGAGRSDGPQGCALRAPRYATASRP